MSDIDNFLDDYAEDDRVINMVEELQREIEEGNDELREEIENYKHQRDMAVSQSRDSFDKIVDLIDGIRSDRDELENGE